MAEINQFGSVKPIRSAQGLSCAECEAMLMDVIDGTFTATQKTAFELHIATCSECSQMLADATRGASLLEMLKYPRPEPPAALLERILAQTSGQNNGLSSFPEPARKSASSMIPVAAAVNAAHDSSNLAPEPAILANVLPFRPRATGRFNFKSIAQTMMQPRLAMTAAMAFFSITLTLNLTGVHLTELKASDLTPSNLKHSYYHANASVVRYYDNLRVVYELESRVNELKRTNQGDNQGDDPAPHPVREDQKKAPDPIKPRKAPKSGSGTSERRDPLGGQFKLARFGSSPALPGSRNRNIEPNDRLNKLKETLQEGDLV